MRNDRQRFLIELAILIIMLAICIFMLAQCLNAKREEALENDIMLYAIPPPVSAGNLIN